MLNGNRLWVFTPCYLDLESFLMLRVDLLRTVRAGLPKAFTEIRFVLIDDTGGTDAELKTAELPGDTKVITPPFNLGHQRALVYGLRKTLPALSDDDLVMTLDADGEDKAEDAPRILASLLEEGQDLGRIVVARRTRRQESISFQAMYFLYKLLFSSLTGEVMRSGNFAAYRASTAKRVLLHPHFDLCYSSSLISQHSNIVLVPCERGTRYAAESRMSFQKLVLHGTRMLLPFLDRIATRALIFFASLTAIGILASVAVLSVRIFTDWGIPGWATYTLLLTLLLSATSLGQFLILITIVSQSEGISLASLDRQE